MNRHLRTLTALIALSAVPAQGSWNLPYPQPATYNYSSLYSQSLNDYLSVEPDLFKNEVAKGWTYYKSTFSNAQTGLINHQRYEGSIVGTNEAVSEGQGYGMLLALINHDQTKFNSIFEAANTHMWNDGTKTYFYWRVWIGGGKDNGAATDADLDIALALVFADKLVSKGHWNAYNRNGVTYASRAMDLIRSIRSRMTQSDYLLPGDNWGGDAIGNLNPSYFATAWFKVFNAYQTQVDYTPVITKCYDVISRMPRYSTGKAVDWCQSSGSRSSLGKPYGMGYDAIRVPWRLAADALWFDDARAKAYCSNTRNTLTQYANSNKGTLVAQMGLYDENGNAIVNSSSCAEKAMWACGILGSRDPAYTRQGVHSVVVAEIVGTSSNYFGAFELHEHEFYYKQSLAILGLALIGGQFPNVMADMSVSTQVPAVSNASAARRVAVSAAGGVLSISGLSGGTWPVQVLRPDGRLVWQGTIDCVSGAESRLALGDGSGAGMLVVRVGGHSASVAAR